MLDRGCALLRSLHVPGRPLVLPNAWDVPSARAVVAAGFPVVATTSAGVAEALGYEDHERAPAADMLAAAARIARAVDVPVTVDAEAGYGMAAEGLVDALMEAGAAGCNIEDTDHATGRPVPPDRQAERLSALRQAAERRGYAVVLNARVDVFLAAGAKAPQGELVEEAVVRARAYLGAGADCVYPILLVEEDAVAAFVDAVRAPVNVLVHPNGPAVPRLAALGVARVSYGPRLFRLTMDHLGAVLQAIAADAAPAG
jgi:2-methylisocitrate lyase-like PEP mutase family enzyme